MSFVVETTYFNGPMELLLDLIDKSKLDIMEISLFELIDQYLDAIETIEAGPDEMSDFIAMASTLLLIKSNTLMPRDEEEPSEELNTREDLIRKLLEYKQYKEMSLVLKEYEKEGAKFYTRLPEDLSAFEPEVELSDFEGEVEILRSIYRTLMDKVVEDPFVVDKVIDRDEYPLETFINRIITRLEDGEIRSLRELLSEKPNGKEVIVVFLALLELMKSGEISVIQNSPEDEICVRRRDAKEDGAV